MFVSNGVERKTCGGLNEVEPQCFWAPQSLVWDIGMDGASGQVFSANRRSKPAVYDISIDVERV